MKVVRTVTHLLSMASVLLASAPLISAPHDVPYGADGLPYLTSNAALVARVSGVEALPTDSTRVSVYSAQIDKVFKGERKEGERIYFAIPKALDVLDASNINGRIAFCSPALTDEQKERFAIPRNLPVLEVVSGAYGMVLTQDESMQAAVQAYIVAESADEKLAWVESHYDEKNPFLQRSALLELAEPSWDVGNPRVLKAISSSIASEAVVPENKGIVLQILEQSESSAALEPLKSLAQLTSAPEPLRLDAVRAVAQRPDGRSVLREWAAGDDHLLAQAAQSVGGSPGIRERPQALEELTRMLASDDPQEYVAAARDAGSLDSSEELVQQLEKAVADPNRDDGFRVLAIESLAKLNSVASARALQAIARDTNQSVPVRTSAILAMTEIESGISAGFLEALPGTLKEASLEALAKSVIPSQS